MSATCSVDPPGVDFSVVLAEVSQGLHDALLRERSELVTDNCLDAGLASQVHLVLDDVRRAIAHSNGGPAVEAIRDPSAEIGVQRAQRGVHPAESLRAATTLFEVALPVLVRAYAASGEASSIVVSRVLHESIMARVALASLSYVSFLLTKLRASRHEERRRIARELHDRVLHTLGSAIQQHDLCRFHAHDLPDVAAEKSEFVMAQLREAARTVQQLSAELRRSVDTDGIEQLLKSYLKMHADSGPRVTFSTVGDLRRLPSDVAEELYLTLREAIRNTLRHAGASALTITLEVDEADGVVASVTDDGCGFDTTNASNEGGGMPSMRERAQLLRGTVTVTSVAGQGTSVMVRAPLRGATL